MTKDTLRKIMPNANRALIDTMYSDLIYGMSAYGINTKKRENYFIAQIAHESGELRYMEELASGKDYEGRRDLGNVEAGDGVKFKGRGLIQITGRANYQIISEALGCDFISKPELLSKSKYAVLSACWFWKKKGLNEYADKGMFQTITRRINGGLNGLNYRLKYLERAEKYNV